MKSLIALSLAACAVAPAMAQPSVGVSIGINQPGVYGRIDIGNTPPPPAAIYYPQPVVIAPSPVAVYQQPIYMYVPPAYQRDWRRYCGRYGACGQPVYFVRDQWVRDQWGRDHYHRPPPPPRPRYVGPPGHHPDGPPGHRRDRGDRHDDHDHRGHGHRDGR